jgi:hypothetical protein
MGIPCNPDKQVFHERNLMAALLILVRAHLTWTRSAFCKHPQCMKLGRADPFAPCCGPSI